MTHAVMMPSRSVAMPSTVATGFIDVIREHQERYLEAVSAAAAPLRDEMGQLPRVAASTTQMTRQFFDAQRAILSRQSTYDAQVGAAGASGANGSYGQNEEFNERLLDFGTWDAEKATRQLAALLDTWWTVLNANGEQVMDQVFARTALRRQVEAIHVPHQSNRKPSASALPTRVLALLDADRATDIRSVLMRLMAELDRPQPAVPAFRPVDHTTGAVPQESRPDVLVAHRPAAFGPPSLAIASPMTAAPMTAAPMTAVAVVADPTRSPAPSPVASVPRPAPEHPKAVARREQTKATAALAPTSDLRIRDVARVDNDSSACLDRLERLEHIQREFWNDRSEPRTPGVVSRVVVPMVAATSALTVVMALVG